MNELLGRESNKVREKCSDGINSRHVRQEQSNKSEKSTICIFATQYFNSIKRAPRDINGSSSK